MSAKFLLENAAYLYKHGIRKRINVATKITALLCDISLQFDCNFINIHKADILILRKSINLIKFPITLLAILTTLLKLQALIKDYNEYDHTIKNELTYNELKAQILNKIAELLGDIVSILIILKVTELFGNKAYAVNLLPAILFMTLSQPINWYFAYTQYSNDGDSSKLCQYSLETATLGFTILSFILQNVVKTQDIPIVLGTDITYTLNYSALVGMTCTAISIFSTLNMLYLTAPPTDQPSPLLDAPYTESTNNHSLDTLQIT